MSINTTNGILDITGAVVRVSKMEFKQATGFDTVFNNIARNTILLSDSATYSTASTYHNWALKLPNAWVLEADVYLASGTAGGGDHTFQLNFYNNVNTDVAQGYVLGLDGTSLTLKYDGTQISTATLSSTLNDNAWHKLFVLFERDTFAVAIDGKAEYTFTDSTLRDRVYNDDAGYVVFYHEAGVDRQIKNIKFVNGDKWIRESGSSNIAYIGGSVGIGTHAPKHTLDVLGNANVGTLTVTSVSGDGSGLSLIQSSNVSDFASNVTRIGNLESADMTIDGEKTFSSNLEVGTANLFVDTTTGHVGIANSSPTNTLHVGSNLYVSDTGSTILTVLGNAAVSNKLTVQGFRVSASAFDGLQATTDADNSTTNSIEITNTTASTDTSSGALTVSGGVGIGGDVHAGGSLTLASGLTVDTNTLKVDAGNNRVGILTASPQYGLDVHGTANVGALTATSSTVSGVLSGGSASISGALSAASASITGQLLVDTDTLTVDAVNDRVGVNTASPSVDLDVVGEAKVSGNVAVNTNTLFVDSVNSRVGVGRTDPRSILDINDTGAMIVPSGTTAQQPATGYAGMLRFNTTTNRLEFYNGNGWNSLGGVVASGGTTSVVGGYKIHTFTTSGNLVVSSGGEMDYLIIAGGGGGGYNHGGGGGAGGYIYTSSSIVSAGTYTVTVGTGGAGSSSYDGGDGTSSSFNSVSTTGGGGGGMGYASNTSRNGRTGGSGGGGGPYASGGAGTVGQGYNGGNGKSYDFAGHGGGGGGAGGQGGNATGTASSTSGTSGAGGLGISSSITGSSVKRAGGGSGGRWGQNQSSIYVGVVEGGGGLGGANGSSGYAAQDATDNTGGGGGGGSDGGGTGGDGGDGIVIIRYLL